MAINVLVLTFIKFLHTLDVFQSLIDVCFSCVMRIFKYMFVDTVPELVAIIIDNCLI